MNSSLIYMLEPKKRILDSLSEIISAFVEVYGDEYSENIISSFKSMELFVFQNKQKLKELMSQLKLQKSVELQNMFLSKIGVNVNDENRKILFGEYSFDYSILFPIENIYKYIDIISEIPDYEIENIKKVFKINEYKEQDIKEYFNSIKNEYTELKKAYDEYIISLKSYQDYIDNCDKLKIQINNKYLISFLNEISECLNNNDKLYISNCIKNNEKIDENNLSISGTILSSNYKFSSLIDSFSDDLEECLNDDKCSSWKKESIICDRIKYFNLLGLNLGNNYQDYINYYNIDKYIPNSILVNKICSLRKKLYKLEELEYIENTSTFERDNKIIDDLCLIDKDKCYTPSTLATEPTSVFPNYRRNSNLIETFNIVFINIQDINDCFIDQKILHELNHAIETSFISNSNNVTTYISGWDILVNGDCCKYETRQFEKFNEIINELISREVHKVMKKNDNYILNDENNIKINGSCIYGFTKFIVIDFYNRFKDDIIESRLTHNMDNLFDKVGRDNFMQMNELINEFVSLFPELTYYNVIIDLKNNVDNSLTRKYKDIEKRSKIIFYNMLDREKEYNNSIMPNSKK